MHGTDSWPVSESGTENILALDWSSESLRPNWLFFVAGKHSSWLQFVLKYLVPSWIFRKDKIVHISGGVDSLVLVGSQRDRGKTWPSSAAVRDFCSLPLRAHRCRTVSSSANWKLLFCRFRLQSFNTPAMLPVFLSPVANALILNCELMKAGSEITENGRFLSGSERRNCSMAAPKWISLTNFWKLTVCRRSSSQTCKSSSENNIQFFFWHFFDRFRKYLFPLGLQSHSVTLR